MDEEERARQEAERLKRVEMQAERDRREAAQEERRQNRVLVAVIAAITLGLLVTWWFSRQPPEPPPAGAFHGPEVPVSQCTFAIGAAADGLPTAQTATVPSGAAVAIVATCTPDVQMVDYVVPGPPDTGVLGFVTAVQDGNTWVWAEAIPLPPGTEIRIWLWVNSRPAGEPVTLTITE